MTKREGTPAPMSPKQIEEKFQETVEYCKKLKEKNRLMSGFDFYISEEGRIAARPLPPSAEFVAMYGGETELTELARKMLASYQEVRHGLAQYMNIESDKWNSSPFGQSLAYIEKTMREEVYKMENSIKGAANGTYNVLTFSFLSHAVQDLAKIVMEPGFGKRWEWTKMNMLNAWATEFDRKNRNRATLQSLSASAETVVLLDEIKRKGEKDVSKLVSTIVTTNLLRSLEQVFKEP